MTDRKIIAMTNEEFEAVLAEAKKQLALGVELPELLRRLGAAVSAPQISRIEWQAILDAMMFTENNVGLVSDAHIRVRKTVERKITDIDMGWDKSVSASPQPRCPKCGNEELRMIADSNSLVINMYCLHGHDFLNIHWPAGFRQFFAAAPAQEPRLMITRSGEIHEWCPDCRGDCCSPYKAAQEQPVENSPQTYFCSNCVQYLTEIEAMDTHDQSHDIVRVYHLPSPQRGKP